MLQAPHGPVRLIQMARAQSRASKGVHAEHDRADPDTKCDQLGRAPMDERPSDNVLVGTAAMQQHDATPCAILPEALSGAPVS